jgi:TRAP-type C4-dicarboxylate transport system permease small subunit
MKKILDNFEEYLLAVIMPVMCSLVFINTLGRYTGLLSLPWAEEASRYMMIWLVFLGISAAAKRNSHFSVQILFLLTPKGFHKYGNLFIMIVTALFCLTVGLLATKFVINLYKMVQASPSLGLPMWTIYSSLPLGLLLMATRTIQFYTRNFKTVWDIKKAATKELDDTLGSGETGSEERK